MNDESRPQAAPEASPDPVPSVNADTDLTAAPHRRWECDGWAYNAGGERLGKCVGHLGVPKPAATQAGVDHALATADAGWLTLATSAVRRAGRAGVPFTSDDLREPPYSVPEPGNPAQGGALLMAMHRRGDIEKCGNTRSRRRAAAGRDITQWRGRRGCG